MYDCFGRAAASESDSAGLSDERLDVRTPSMAGGSPASDEVRVPPALRKPSLQCGQCGQCRRLGRWLVALSLSPAFQSHRAEATSIGLAGGARGLPGQNPGTTRDRAALTNPLTDPADQGVEVVARPGGGGKGTRCRDIKTHVLTTVLLLTQMLHTQPPRRQRDLSRRQRPGTY